MTRASSAAKTRKAKPAAKPTARPAVDPTRVSFDLDSGRWRHASSALFWFAGAALMALGIGGAGVWLGAVLGLLGLGSLRGFVVSLLHPPGHVTVDESRISLPAGLCKPGVVELVPGQLRHAYFLRRSVPVRLAAPVLVVEAEPGIYSFPRDWFATDGDQIRLARALNAHIRGE